MKKALSVLPMLFLAVFLWGQKVVSGVITSVEDGQPVIGASILIKGTTTGTVTDLDGAYTLTVPGNDAVLLVSYTGLKALEVVVGERSKIDAAMESNVSFLDEIVVTGYGTQGRRVITSAISSVKAEDIQNLPSASVDQLIQGRAAGVQISSNSGTPGGGMFVRVRGTTSLTAGSDPLYVVDGIPIVTRPLEANGTGGQQTNPLADLNPADIESVEILKDASATAIYGARAANGVVLITTKRGSKSQNAQVSFNAYAGVQSLWRSPSDQVTNAREYEELSNEVLINQGRPALYPNPGSGVNTDWNSYIFQDAPIYNADLSISGGNDRVRYFISGNYFDQEGILKNSSFTRYTGRLNLDFSATDKIKLGTSILYSRNDRSRVGNDDNISGAMGGAYFIPSNLPPYQPNGSYTKHNIFENPIAAVTLDDRLIA